LPDDLHKSIEVHIFGYEGTIENYYMYLLGILNILKSKNCRLPQQNANIGHSIKLAISNQYFYSLDFQAGLDRRFEVEILNPAACNFTP
jgi:hypothetical protein